MSRKSSDRRRMARWAVGGAAVTATVAAGLMAAPAAMAVPTVPVPCSVTALRNAIAFAPANSILVLSQNCVYRITSKLPTIFIDRSISGSNAVIDSVAGVFTPLVIDGANVTINNLTFENGFGGAAAPGAILNEDGGALTLQTDTFFDNYGNPGGAIENAVGSTLGITNSTFTGNRATGAAGGGAILNAILSSVTVSGTTFLGNEAPAPAGDGGAIDSLGGSVTLTGVKSTFANNYAGDDGGAIGAFGGLLNVGNATFTANEADDAGGALANLGAAATVSGSAFTANFSHAGSGGAIATATALYLGGDTISGNAADDHGGGIYVVGGQTTLNQTDVFGNASGLSGGGIYRAGPSFVSLTNGSLVELNRPNNCTGLICF